MSDLREPEAILLDLDDTILVHGAVADNCWKNLCYRFAPRIEELEPDRLLNAINEARDWYWSDPERHRKGRLNLFVARRELVSLAFSNLGIDNTDVADQLADTYSTEREEAIVPFPGAIDALKHFRNHGIKLALVSNGSSEVQLKKVERFNLASYFNCIIIEGEFGVGKPDKRVFLHALGKLRVSPEKAWMVGDNLEWDVAGAQKAGIFAIWVDWRGEGLPELSTVEPDRIIRNISELL